MGLLETSNNLHIVGLILILKKNSIYHYPSIHPLELYKRQCVCFFKKAIKMQYVIQSITLGEEIYITKQVIADAFGLKNKGIAVDAQKTRPSKDLSPNQDSWAAQQNKNQWKEAKNTEGL